MTFLQFAIKVENYSPMSAGFSHCACIVDGSVYMWGSNGINCALVINAPQGIQKIIFFD